MRFEHYQRRSERTLNTGLSREHALVDYTLGLVGETSELEDDIATPRLANEAGDVLWYAAAICTTLGLDFQFLALSHQTVSHRYRGTESIVLYRLASRIAERVKKHVFHGKDIDLKRIASLLSEYVARVIVLCEERGLNVSDVLDSNVAKLDARYPDGFR